MNRIGFSSMSSSAAISMWYKPFYVNLFFFISGYLLFKKYHEVHFDKIDNKVWGNQYGHPLLSNIIFKIAIPTIIFSAIMLWKFAIRGDNGNLFSRIINDSILGGSMWFTAALAISELILYIIFKVYRSRNFLIYIIISVVLAILATQLTLFDVTIMNNNNIPWRYKSGMIATLFLISGGIFNKYEDFFSKCNLLKKCLLYVPILLFYIISLIYCKELVYTNIGAGKITILGYFIAISISLLIIQICKCFQSNRFVDFFGRHTLVLYFLSGALPETMGMVMMKVRPVLDWGQVFFTTILALSIAFVLTYLINQYIPWLLDFRQLRKKIG